MSACTASLAPTLLPSPRLPHVLLSSNRPAMALFARQLRTALLSSLLSLLLARGAFAVVTLKNGNGMEVTVLETGACLQRVVVPAADGSLADVMLGSDSEEWYANGTSVSGCIVGRYGGRITGGKIYVDGVTYQLETGKDGNTLHGGGIGLQRLPWVYEELSQEQFSGLNESYVTLTFDSPAGAQNFPGNLSLTVTYTLNGENELMIDIQATTDADTPVNVFNHPYFNLAGLATDQASILNHTLQINADYYVATDNTSTPTGVMAPVAGTPLDFTTPHTIGERIAAYANTTKGYNHQFVLFGNGPDAKDKINGFEAADPPKLAATMVDPVSKRGLEIYTTAPTMVLYTGNAFKGPPKGMYTKGGVQPRQYAAVALEATMFPEAGNPAFPTFPSPILKPGQTYRNTVIWRFFDA